MESSAAEREKRKEETYYLYSPCHLFEKLIKAFYKCSGKHHDDDDDNQQAQAEAGATSASGAETEMKTTEEENITESKTTRAIRFIKRPPRPPVSSGRGAKIN